MPHNECFYYIIPKVAYKGEPVLVFISFTPMNISQYFLQSTAVSAHTL